ncbi:LPXTG cell wall anchor domain-containing protein [Arthrobacter sp. Sa2CUA1]|uniref:LPXTG cell wall anchor domain-containing protein n=1 Tax=Arthrobacter gallicola TaxID=2762225 RepID=A0ABR8UUK8_9MICC|nr:LPXTG cell wall anchor domain-containing protein [Arthrobacter gallicola]MBD7996075.1 LPXTG cell wall anchor domain-containing protein [Arthrobacter gallicola]
MKKAASTLALAGALTLTGATAAVANEYPAPPASVSGMVCAAVADPGGLVDFSGSGATPGEIIDITVDFSNNPNTVSGTGVNGLIILNQRVAALTATAAADGVFKTDIRLGEAGTYALTGVARDSGRTYTATVAAVPGAGPTPCDKRAAAATGPAAGAVLASTGADSNVFLWGAAGALALGAGVVSVAVVRRKKDV